MAGRRKAEGIALLSMYNDDDGDEEEHEEEDEEQENEENEEEQQEHQYPELDLHEEERQDRGPESPRTTTAETASGAASTKRNHIPVVDRDRTSNTAQGIIVDYAHDEPALSPDAEEDDIISSGKEVFGSDMQVQMANDDKFEETKGAQSSDEAAPTFLDADGVAMETSEVDPLADFLPPPPVEKCSDELQQKFARYLALKNAGRSFNEELRKSKGYRNPDFLQRAVKYQEIDQIGSCFKKEIFDPHGYDPSDFYDALALEFRREKERKEQAKKQNQRVDFVQGGIQAPPVLAIPDKSKLLLPVATGQKGANLVNPLVHSVPEALTKQDAGRTNKKSKWDKVDSDARPTQTLPPVAKTAMAAASAHTAMLTANAGGGYASFAQQKRKEIEERSRGSEKRSDRK